jgi:hypothetical protein
VAEVPFPGHSCPAYGHAVTESDAPSTAHDLAVTAPDPLPALQQQFPAFLIWRENMSGRRRYVARSQHLSVNPHTVVTDDPDELRAALSRPS